MPQRSSGCLTCRRRKVKCDERRPSCRRCENGVFSCGGYSKPLVFRNQGTWPVADSRSAGGIRPASSHNSGGISSSCSPSDPGHEALPRRQHPTQSSWAVILQQKSSTGPRTPANLAQHATPPCQSLHLAAFQEGIVISHLMHRMFAQPNPQPASRLRNSNPPWVSQILVTTSPSSTPYLCLLALATAFFSRTQKDPALGRQSIGIYCRALRGLVSDVSQLGHSPSVSCNVLWSSLCLGTYELVTASNLTGWVRHTSGVAAAIEGLGPQAFAKGLAHATFTANRAFIALSYVARRKRCFLELRTWMTIPWSVDDNDPQSKRSASTRIEDVLCTIPSIMEDERAIKNIPGLTREASLAQEAFHARIMAILQELQRLRGLWEEEYPHAWWEAEATPGRDEDGEANIFPTVLHFHDFSRAVELAYLNAMTLVLHSMYYRTAAGTKTTSQREMPPETPRDRSPLLSPGDCGVRALEICRLVDWCFLEDRDSLAAFVLLFPLRVCYDHLTGYPRVARWLRCLMKDIAESKGLEIGEHILDQGGFMIGT